MKLQVFSGNANPALAGSIAEYLGIPLGRAFVGRFPDGEIDVRVDDDVRGSDVFLVQPTCPPVNDNIMELLLLIDTVRRASAGRITAVMPYFGYARKDRKDRGRVPISAKLVANAIVAAGVDRVVTMDLHAGQVQGFFDIPVDHLYASPVMVEYFETLKTEDLCVVSPDVGGIKMARAYSKVLNARLAVVDKRRTGPDAVEVGFVIGDVEDMNVLIVDDLIATGGSITQAARVVKEQGARDVRLCAPHAVFCGKAVERINDAPVEEVVVSDSIPPRTDDCKKIHVRSIAGLFGEAILRIHEHRSVSSLFPDSEL